MRPDVTVFIKRSVDTVIWAGVFLPGFLLLDIVQRLPKKIDFGQQGRCLCIGGGYPSCCEQLNGFPRWRLRNRHGLAIDIVEHRVQIEEFVGKPHLSQQFLGFGGYGLYCRDR